MGGPPIAMTVVHTLYCSHQCAVTVSSLHPVTASPAFWSIHFPKKEGQQDRLQSSAATFDHKARYSSSRSSAAHSRFSSPLATVSTGLGLPGVVSQTLIVSRAKAFSGYDCYFHLFTVKIRQENNRYHSRSPE